MPAERQPTPSPRLLVFTSLERAAREVMLRQFARLSQLARKQSVLFVLRDYELSARERVKFGRELLQVARGGEQLLAVADRADIALLLDADALHLPERGLDARDARRLVGERRLLSRACHDPERVADHACDLVVLSPIVAARKGNAPLGVEALARARRRLALAAQQPLLFALGGVSAETAEACLRAGADGVAVIGAALVDDPLSLLLAIGIERKN